MKLFLAFSLALCAFAQEPAPVQEPVVPAVLWNNPADIRYPEPLTATQLTAVSNVPGTFVYTPPVGTVLPAGNGQTLTVTFTPSDSALQPVTKTVAINVLPTYWPYDPSETAYICHVNPDLTPVIDTSVGRPRCFVVPVPVNQAITKFMLTQVEGLNADGSVKYRYASWWDLITKHFITTLVNPMLDQFPPADIAKAKADAAAAMAAVDSAKAAILMGGQQQ